MALTLTYQPDTTTITVVFAPSAVSVTIALARDAYQLALAEGFVGSRAEWLSSLQGPSGSGKTWVAITSAAYDALSAGDRNDSTKVYDITDFTW